MAYISMFICCRSAEPINNGKSIQIIDPTDEFQIDYIPSLFSFSLVFGLNDIDFSSSHTINVILKGENNGAELMRQALSTPIGQTNLLGKIQFLVRIENANIPTEGYYYCDILLDGTNLGENRILITKARSL